MSAATMLLTATLGIALVFTSVAAAGPKTGDQFTPGQREWVDKTKPVDPSSALVVMLIDRSGSMRGIHKSVVESCNGFIEKQRSFDSEANTSTKVLFSRFDDRYEVLHRGTDAAAVEAITYDQLEPRGTTALHDSFGRVLTDAVDMVNSMEKTPAKITVFVMTDGLENSSREWQAAKVKKMVGELKQAHQWQFIFAAANQDAVLTGADLGMERGESISYRARGANSASLFESVYASQGRYRTNQRSGFMEEELAAAMNVDL